MTSLPRVGTLSGNVAAIDSANARNVMRPTVSYKNTSGGSPQWLLAIIAALTLVSCSVSRVPIIEKKYPRHQLVKDYSIFQGALEESHPSLYWFTPKDSMDMHFNNGLSALKDSMTEREFRMVLLKAVTPIRCGHTSVSYSRKYSKYLDTADLKIFPLAFKVWSDTLAVTGNLHKTDSMLLRGTQVTAINGRSARFFIDTFFHYLTGDGYSLTGRYQSLSSYGTFGVLYKNLFGLSDSFKISYINEWGYPSETTVPVFRPAPDSAEKPDSLKPEKYTPRERRNRSFVSSRTIQVDTTLKSAYMTVHTFARHGRLRRFYRYAFRNIEKLQLKHLVIDVRSNGGGDAGNSTALTQYLTDHPFVIADSLYAIRRSTRYRDHIPFQPLYWLATVFITKKRADGNFHFGYFERHTFKPRKRHHFDGQIYILTGGNSFSATTLFANELKGQPNVKIIGEETGGGGYGNTAWIIPELILPNTKVRVAIPKFRFVMRPDLISGGLGVQPDIYAAPALPDIQKGRDVKIEAARRLIIQDYLRSR